MKYYTENEEKFAKDYLKKEFNFLQEKIKTSKNRTKEDAFELFSSKNIQKLVKNEIEKFAELGIISENYLICKLKTIIDYSLEKVETKDKNGEISDIAPRSLTSALKSIELLLKLKSKPEEENN